MNMYRIMSFRAPLQTLRDLSTDSPSAATSAADGSFTGPSLASSRPQRSRPEIVVATPAALARALCVDGGSMVCRFGIGWGGRFFRAHFSQQIFQSRFFGKIFFRVDFIRARCGDSKVFFQNLAMGI
jgi:hypothetical protein